MEDLGDDIDAKSSKKKYLTWAIIAIVIVAVIAIPLVVMRQSEPAEATEPATIEQLEAEIDALYVTVYGTTEVEGLETKIAAQAELIANIETGDCVCPDWTGQFSSINSDIATLRTDVDAIVVTDYSVNISQIDADLTTLSADLTAAATALSELRVRVDDIVGTDWGSDVTELSNAIDSLNDEVIDIEARIGVLEAEPTGATLPRYAMVTEIDGRTISVAVYGNGDFPIIVSFYGSGFVSESHLEGWALLGSILINPSWDYAVSDVYLYGVGNTMLVAIIEMGGVEAWESGDIISFEVTVGTIDYVTASTGGS